MNFYNAYYKYKEIKNFLRPKKKVASVFLKTKFSSSLPDTKYAEKLTELI